MIIGMITRTEVLESLLRTKRWVFYQHKGSHALFTQQIKDDQGILQSIHDSDVFREAPTGGGTCKGTLCFYQDGCS
jgi:hypothetical protein